MYTLRDYKNNPAAFPKAFVACSKTITESGYLQITGVNNEWWIQTTIGRSFSLCPTEPIFTESETESNLNRHFLFPLLMSFTDQKTLKTLFNKELYFNWNERRKWQNP